MKADNLIDLALEMGSYEWAKQLVEMKRNPKVELLEEVTELNNVQTNEIKLYKALQDIKDPFVMIYGDGIRPFPMFGGYSDDDINNCKVGRVNTRKYLTNLHGVYYIEIEKGDLVEVDIVSEFLLK